MKHRVCIFTTSKNSWFKDELADIQRVQQLSKGVTYEYEIRTIALTKIPLDTRADGSKRPSWKWFKLKLTDQAKGYTQVTLHLSVAERNKFGISRHLGGTYNDDNDNVIEFWFCADKGQKAKHYKGKSEFWRRFLHESAHGSERFLIGKDSELTHHYDYVLHDLEGLYKRFDWTTWGKLYEKVLELTGMLEKGVHPTTDLLPLVLRKRDELSQKCRAAGVPVRFMSGYRSCEQQNALYAQGRTMPGNIVTNAKCGESMHNYGVAFDIAFDSATPYIGDWEKVGKIGESIGLEWGGRWADFVDKPHFQVTLGYTLKDFQGGKVDYTKFS